MEPVQFTRPLADTRVARLGEPATFECELSAADARAQWLKDGFDLHAGAKYEMGVAGRSYRLTVRDVDDRDAGDYAIVVKGHRSEARLDVEARPEFKVVASICFGINQSIDLFASKYTYTNIIYVNGRSPEKHRVQLAGDL